jgi:glyoxylase-like metal-dependent hydrolase (beta-lactamase superfamily II)
VIRLERVLAPNPGVYTLEGTNTWIVGDDPAIVIDPGPADDGHLREVARIAGRVAAVLVTHDHEDHAEGAARFAELVGAPLRAARIAGAARFTDGEVIAGGAGAEIHAVPTPGHSADHWAFWIPAAGALATGDAVLGRGTSFIDPPDGDLAAYLDSLDRMAALGARTILPGHGPVVLDAAAKLAEYRAHRLEREAQIVAALADGPAAVAEIVDVVYEGYPPEVLPLAARSVTAHLRKLADESRVTKDGHGQAQRWSLAAPKACARCGRTITVAGRYCRRCLVTMLQGGSEAPAPPTASSADQP